MESRDIYNRSRKTIQWEEKWIHIGTGQKIKLEQLTSHIDDQFQIEKTLILKRGRRNSEETQKKNILIKIKNLIGLEDFELWNKQFDKAIKFNKLGVINKSKNAI